MTEKVPSGRNDKDSVRPKWQRLLPGQNDVKARTSGLPSHFGIDHHPGPGPEGNLVQDGGLVLYAVPGKGKLT